MESQPDEREVLDRKERSHERMKKEQIPFNEHLPAIQSAAEMTPRSPQEVARRAVVAAAIAAYAAGGHEREALHGFLEREKLSDAVTPAERAFIDDESPDQQDVINYSWRFEAVWALMWALGQHDEMYCPTEPCDPDEIHGPIFEDGVSAFIEQAHLRPAPEQLDMADLYYRYAWSCRQHALEGRPAPAGMETGAVMERFYALNWLVGEGDDAYEDWDDVDTST